MALPDHHPVFSYVLWDVQSRWMNRARAARRLRTLCGIGLEWEEADPGVVGAVVECEYNNPGDVVKPGFLSFITGNQKPAKIRLDPFKRWPTRSRRMA